MTLVQLLNRLEEIRAEYGNLPEIYVAMNTTHPIGYFFGELLNIDVEERRTLFLNAESEIESDSLRSAADQVK